MPKLFISYRRSDEAFAVNAIAERLFDVFGRESVFRDVDSLPKGLDFRTGIHDAVSRCDVLLAVIGDAWLDVRYTEGPRAGRRRLDDPDDWVRIELEAALARDIPVIPITIGEVDVPTVDDLPPSLQELPYRSASKLRSAPDLKRDLDQLVQDIRALLRSRVDSGSGADASAAPDQVGTYAISKSLGSGSFGNVFLAHDQQRDRAVAVRLFRRQWFTRHTDAQSIVDQSRPLIDLVHPAIAPVVECGIADNGLPFIVTDFVDGNDLGTISVIRRPSPAESASIVATIADALQHAHQRRIYHQDIRPQVILVDRAGQPKLVDFAVGVGEEDHVRGIGMAGLPHYISPEQARGEGHRIDGRCDIFSLGAVFYELLTRRRPFLGKSREHLLEEIVRAEPQPPRQLDDAIPKELERICLKALSKRAADRYNTARDLADEIRLALSGDASLGGDTSTGGDGGGARPAGDTPRIDDPADAGVGPPARVQFKRLQAFDAGDADYFLELVPGPRDRDGLPEAIAFWKSRIEPSKSHGVFAVGLMYGPSGCGKSSLVQAGLLPRLSERVADVFVEATPEGTEAELLAALHKRDSSLPAELDLPQTVAAIRRGEGVPPGHKVLIVLDQFEQWLHARQVDEQAPLVQALRHCDGARVQCLLLVRDEYWMAVTELGLALEDRLVEGENAASVDLFDRRHARRVLTWFGQSGGALPADDESLTDENRRFVELAVQELARVRTDKKINCVRLAMFADMVMDEPWDPETVERLGGIDEVGVMFLKKLFDELTAPLMLRPYLRVAREVLEQLLPLGDVPIKGGMRSRESLYAAVGRGVSLEAFDDVLEILNSQLRLITPTAPTESVRPMDDATSDTAAGRYYQLTHDYLVPSLRVWLAEEQRATWRGRAALCLASQTARWTENRHPRHFPSAAECMTILVGVPWARRKRPEQRAMLNAALRYRGLRWGAAALVLLVVLIGVRSYVNRGRARSSVETLLTAAPDGVRQVKKALDPVQPWAMELLRRVKHSQQAPAKHRLRAACALAWYGEPDVEFLVGQMANDIEEESVNVIDALHYAKPQAIEALRAVFDSDRENVVQRARMATVLVCLGDESRAKEMLGQADAPNELSDPQIASAPRERVEFIHQFSSWHGSLEDVNDIISLQKASQADDLRSGICAALGTIDARRLPDDKRQTLAQTLLGVFRKDNNAATHSAARYALRNWGVALDTVERELATRDTESDTNWYVNKGGITMLRIEAGALHVPADPVSFDPESTIRIDQPFFLNDREVTVGQFMRFVASVNDEAWPNKQVWLSRWKNDSEKFSPTREHPIQSATWEDVAYFCNWLSEREGRDACYRKDAGQGVEGGPATEGDWVPTGEGWLLNQNADGYRLPTVQEWEWACRAKTTTPFVCGDATLLSDYAVYNQTEAAGPSPCGSKLPSAWGLFDMHGNVWEWCRSTPDALGPGRGGAWFRDAENCRSASQITYGLNGQHHSLGFRVARYPSSITQSPVMGNTP